MLRIIQLNYPAIFIATLVGVCIGIIWYSPLLFRKILLDDLKKNKHELNKFIIPFIITIFGMFILSVILDTFLFFSGFVGMNRFEAAIVIGITISVGIIALNMLSDYLISGTHMKYFIVHAGYRIILTLLMSITLALWR